MRCRDLVSVFLDGEKISFATAADDEEGWVDVVKSIPFGSPPEEGWERTSERGSLHKKRSSGCVRLEARPPCDLSNPWWLEQVH